MICKDDSILVVAAHPDDEILGCGGFLHKWRSLGAQCQALILAEGFTSRSTQAQTETNLRETQQLRAQAAQASASLGLPEPLFAGFPDNAMDSLPLLEIVKHVESVANTYKPTVVITHHFGDTNIDHRLCHEACLTAFRALPASQVHTLLSFETLSSTEWRHYQPSTAFVPTYFEVLSEANLQAKRQAMQAYTSELREYPHPRSIKGIEILAAREGLRIGEPWAESFSIIRHTSRG